MKKSNFICLASIFSLAFVNVSQAQIDVQSNGAVKVGNLDKTTHLSGSSLEVAVTKLFIYPTNNLKGAFTISNNTIVTSPGIGGGIVTSSSNDNMTPYNLPTYIEPYNAGYLYAGSSSLPLGGVYTQKLTTYNQWTSSDRRVKKDILDLPSALPSIRSLRPVSFNYDIEKLPLNPDQAENRAGFIAQEVLNVLPNLVSYDSAADLYSLDYISLIPYLTKAIQEQDAQIQQQQALLESYAEALANLSQQLSLLETSANNSKKAPVNAPNAATGNETENDAVQNILYQNIPNPSDRDTRIRYELNADAANARIGIYQLNGQEVSMHNLTDAKGELVINAGELTPGMYLYSLIVNGEVQDTKRMVITR